MMKFALLAATLTMPLLINCVDRSPGLGSVDQDSQGTFVGMLLRNIGAGATLNLNGYGCYCGPGNDVGVIPVDATDSCCMTHDYAWMAAKDVAEGCNCNTQSYDYNTTKTGIVCTANQSACAMYCCAADKAFTECVQANPPNTVANRNYDRSTCEPLECNVDDDCEGGTWCNEGRCVPFCGGGSGSGSGFGSGSGSARTAYDDVTCANPPNPVVVNTATVTTTAM